MQVMRGKQTLHVPAHISKMELMSSFGILDMVDKEKAITGTISSKLSKSAHGKILHFLEKLIFSCAYSNNLR